MNESLEVLAKIIKELEKTEGAALNLWKNKLLTSKQTTKILKKLKKKIEAVQTEISKGQHLLF
jgi:exonuclease VII small subunit